MSGTQPEFTIEKQGTEPLFVLFRQAGKDSRSYTLQQLDDAIIDYDRPGPRPVPLATMERALNGMLALENAMGPR
jgi:hypothetical protein